MSKYLRSMSPWKKMLAVTTTGMMFASSCSGTEARVILAGLDAAARIVNDEQNNNDVSLGDWLSSQLDNL